MLKLTILLGLIAFAQCQRGRQQNIDILDRGFDTIVTPEPLENEPVRTTVAPQILNNNEGFKCRCVPYHQCDTDNAVKTTDNRINPFGEVNIRYDPDSCQDVLDVCCKEHQIIPSPQTSPQYQQKGCGIRKVGGIDFNMVGNNVSSEVDI